MHFEKKLIKMHGFDFGVELVFIKWIDQKSQF